MRRLLPWMVLILIGAPTAALAGDDQPAGAKCVSAEEARAHTAGESAPPKFGRAFQAHTFTLDASLDGLEGDQLPISIDTVCSVPKKFKKKAAKFAGNDGIALVSERTKVFQGDELLEGTAATAALD